MKYTKENAVNGYFSDVIKKSWTWARLTEEERRQFENLNGLDHIKGTAAQRVEWLHSLYHAFLTGLGYTPIGWREPEPESIPKF